MARTYDSGLADPIRTTIAADVLLLLDKTSRQKGGFAQKIFRAPYVLRSYVNSDEELNMIEDLLEGANVAYAVAIGDAKVLRTGAAGNNRLEFDVEVYSISSHMRNVVTGRLAADLRARNDDTVDPGIDVMMELARMYLTDVGLPTIGKRGDVLRFKGEHHIATGQESSIWASEFSISVSGNTDMLRGADKYLEEIMTFHRVGAGTADDGPVVITTLTDLTDGT